LVNRFKKVLLEVGDTAHVHWRARPIDEQSG
jgi:hypothetical protein